MLDTGEVDAVQGVGSAGDAVHLRLCHGLVLLRDGEQVEHLVDVRDQDGLQVGDVVRHRRQARS